jgi:hypothetical protein
MCSLYAGGVLFAILFTILDLVYEIEEIKGFWIIFCPFAPALLWSLAMRSRATKMIAKEKGD